MSERPAVECTDESKVWLECNGELIDIRSVAIVGTREAVPGVEFVKFRCPRCGSSHESLRFLPIPDASAATNCPFA
jgi:hypothetical protein